MKNATNRNKIAYEKDVKKLREKLAMASKRPGNPIREQIKAEIKACKKRLKDCTLFNWRY